MSEKKMSEKKIKKNKKQRCGKLEWATAHFLV